jgi:hypothetical protein
MSRVSTRFDSAPTSVNFHEDSSEEPLMVRRGRPGVRFSILVASLLLVIIAAAGIHIALKPRGPDGQQDGFLAYGRISVAIFGSDVNTVETKRCIASSVQAGIEVRQGIPIVISLDGRAVGGGDLSTGELTREVIQRGHSELWGASCEYKFSAPVTRPGEGRYTVDVGEAKVAFSMDDLRNGIDLNLS